MSKKPSSTYPITGEPGSKSEYPVSTWKKRRFRYGKHFSEHVHGMLVNPRPTIRKIAKEPVIPQDLAIPFSVVLCAALITVIGSSIWGIVLSHHFVFAFLETLYFFVKLFAVPILFILSWVVWTLIVHFFGSVASGKDITNTHRLHITLKLIGLAFVPWFLCLIPFFSYVAIFWSWVLSLWIAEIVYGLKRKKALMVSAPAFLFIFLWVLTKLQFLGLL